MSDERKHSRYGGSVADRYMNCAGSVALCASVPKIPAGEAAARGTVAHDIAEKCLAKQLHPTHFLGEVRQQEGWTIIVDQKMCDWVVTYCNVVEHEMAQSKTAELYVEVGFALNVATAEPGEVFGANDCLVYHPELKRLRVFDFKTGAQQVTADDNKQLLFYALGALTAHPEWGIKEIVLTIVQPNGWEVDAGLMDAVRDWTFRPAELLDFATDLERAIGAAKEAQITFVAAHSATADPDRTIPLQVGSWCKWCDAAAANICPAKEAQALAAISRAVEGLNVTSLTDLNTAPLADPTGWNVEHLSASLAALEKLSQWKGKVEQLLFDVMKNQGITQTEHFKIAPKQARAKWIEDEKKVAGYLTLTHDVDQAAVLPPSLVTITEAVALLKRAGATRQEIESFKLKFTIKESSGYTLAPLSDARPATSAIADNLAGVDLIGA